MHNAYDYGYVDWHSWAVYLSDHPGYKAYQPINDVKKYGCNWGAWVTFPQKIEAIQARVGNTSSPFELFRSKDFLVIYKHPGYYWSAFLDYIVDKRYTLAQKKIAIYATTKNQSLVFWEIAYDLYQKKKIDLSLLELLLAIGLSNHSDHPDFMGRLQKRTRNQYLRVLQVIQNNIPKNSSLYKGLESILLTNTLPKPWYKYRIHSGNHDISYHYYVSPLPFYDILTDAVRDANYVRNGYGGNSPFGLETYPYFLIVMEHPQDYYPAHFELGRSIQCNPKEGGNGIDILRYKGYTDEEKSMAIFGMSQLGVTSSHESSAYYAFVVEHAIEWYKQGNLSVHHLLQLFICNFNTHYKYPFFILDYKEKAIQKALNKFIAEPTIPEGIKEIARKVKNGILATKEEIDYMEGYRTFRKTHFTLYETIVPPFSSSLN